MRAGGATARPYPKLLEAFENEKVFVGITYDEIVADVATTRQVDLLSIGQLAVHPERQGQGIGKRILNRIESMARSQSATRRAVQTGEIMLGRLSL